MNVQLDQLLIWIIVVGLPLGLETVPAPLDGTLTANIVIESDVLDYKLQYRVYLPQGYDSLHSLPVVYLTDGESYLGRGELPWIIDDLIKDNKIEPVVAVFVDARDPENLVNNRRNEQFFCNPRYARFFEQELIPKIDANFKTASDREHRVILGLSFGGLNSACFGLLARDSFAGIAMQSPATHPVSTLHESYEQSDPLPLKIFLSSGSKRDNKGSTRKLRDILESKGYDMKYIEVPFGHSWDNWGPLIDDVLVFFFARHED